MYKNFSVHHAFYVKKIELNLSYITKIKELIFFFTFDKTEFKIIHHAFSLASQSIHTISVVRCGTDNSIPQPILRDSRVYIQIVGCTEGFQLRV